ncbi:MAG: hypothetical protein NVS3B20_08330 [Polyangiales bacterium]
MEATRRFDRQRATLIGPVSRKSTLDSIPPSAIEGYLEAYSSRPDELEADALLVLARVFERMGCDEQALDCAKRAATLDPESKSAAVEVARKCVGRVSRPV